MTKRHEQLVRKHDERMARISAEIDAQKARMTPNYDAMRSEELAAQLTAANRKIAGLEVDIANALYLLRCVRYTQTVGEITTIRLACDRIEQRWRIKPQRRIEVQP